MQITVRYFAAHRDITGMASERIDVADGSTLGQIWDALEARYPALSPYRGRVLLACNERFGDASTPVTAGDTVAFIPPVSGGLGTPLFWVTSEPLGAAPLEAAVAAPDMGAIVTFAGTVRDHFGERATARLEYEAYVEMAVPVLADIASEAQAAFAIGRVAIHHRIGVLELGEKAVIVVVAAAHRGPALAATGWIMDRIKEVAPIWKKEHWADGAQDWIGNEKQR
jgi:molybdopterin synthase catalytic subunit